jgi:hypothetical protein
MITDELGPHTITHYLDRSLLSDCAEPAWCYDMVFGVVPWPNGGEKNAGAAMTQ